MQRYLAAVLLVLFVAVPCSAALPSTAVWEVRTTGSNNNGGCFNSAAGGTDFSKQDANQYTFSDAVLVTTTTVSSASHNFVAADVGNCIHFTAGTGFTVGWYMINSVLANVATLDRAAGTGGSTGGTFFVGGAIATLAQLNTNMVTGNTAWVKATATYSHAASLTFNYSGGAGGVNQYSNITGYTTTRGDGGQATIQYTASFSAYGLILNQQQLTLTNFIIDCNSQTNTGGLNLNLEGARAVNVKVMNCTAGALSGITLIGTFTSCFYCTVTAISGTGGGFLVSANNSHFLCYYCNAIANSVTGFNAIAASNGVECIGCISANNSGASSDCFSFAVTQGTANMVGNTAYNCGRDGFRFTGVGRGNWNIANNISYGNAGKSFNYTNGAFPVGIQYLNFNAYASGTLTNYVAGPNDVTLTADPFVNGAGNNFALNSTAGGGAALKGVGFPGVLTLGGTGFRDIGALQVVGTPGAGIVAIGSVQ